MTIMHYKITHTLAALAMAASMTLAGCGTPAKTQRRFLKAKSIDLLLKNNT